MGQRLECDTVRDLLPVYIDKMTSEATNRAIEEHLEGCRECCAVLEQMQRPIPVETAPEVRDFKKFLRKSKMSIFYWIMGISAVAAVITCFIVNLAVDKELSWFYIVVAGIVTAYLPAYVWIISPKNKFVRALAVVNVCTFGLLAVVQYVLYYLMHSGDLWFWKVGIPVALMWTAIIWFAVACDIFFHANSVLIVAIIALLAVPANCITNILAGEYHNLNDYFASFVSNGLANVVIGMILLVIGIVIQIRKKPSVKR